MVYGAIDLHIRYSQIRITDETGVVRRDQRVVTSRERLVKAFDGPGPLRILLETGTERPEDTETRRRAQMARGRAALRAVVSAGRGQK